ncbi:MAG TPA: hypothetical protein VKX17_12955 [Planctomycetota bacterium]|nr:hypothetical protein [Planctomycetota bacterium]
MTGKVNSVPPPATELTAPARIATAKVTRQCVGVMAAFCGNQIAKLRKLNDPESVTARRRADSREPFAKGVYFFFAALSFFGFFTSFF